MNQIVHPNYPLRDIDETIFPVHAEWLRNRLDDYVHGKIPVYFCTDINLESATLCSAVQTLQGNHLLQGGYFNVMLDERHRRRSVQMINDKNGAGWD